MLVWAFLWGCGPHTPYSHSSTIQMISHAKLLVSVIMNVHSCLCPVSSPLCTSDSQCSSASVICRNTHMILLALEEAGYRELAAMRTVTSCWTWTRQGTWHWIFPSWERSWWRRMTTDSQVFTWTADWSGGEPVYKMGQSRCYFLSKFRSFSVCSKMWHIFN